MAWLQKLTTAWDSRESVDTSAEDSAAAKRISRTLFQAAARRVDEVQQAASRRVDQAAERFARSCTEWTGREMSVDDVKRSAKIGATIGAVMAAGPMAAVALRQARTTSAAGRSHGSEGGGVAASSANMHSHAPHLDSSDPSWEQDDIDYDRTQHDHLLDHVDNQNRLDDVVDDHDSYNAAMDCSFDIDF